MFLTREQMHCLYSHRIWEGRRERDPDFLTQYIITATTAAVVAAAAGIVIMMMITIILFFIVIIIILTIIIIICIIVTTFAIRYTISVLSFFAFVFCLFSCFLLLLQMLFCFCFFLFIDLRRSEPVRFF